MYTSCSSTCTFLTVVPQIVIHPNDTEVLAGNTLLLSCTGYGIPLPSIVWGKDGQRLDSDSQRSSWEEMVIVGNHTFRRSYLQICGSVELDSGDYSCSVVTEERENSVEFSVRIISVPATLIDTPEDVSIVAEMGTSIIASCVAFGSPAPEISWTMLQRGTTSVIDSNSTGVSLSVFSEQFVRNGVGIVYSSLLLCPTHPGALTTNMISCTTDNQVNGSNFTSHSFLVNVSGKKST